MNDCLSQRRHVCRGGPQAPVGDASQSGLWGRQRRGRVVDGEEIRLQSAGEVTGVRRQGGTQHEEQQTSVTLQSSPQLQYSHRGRQVLWQGADIIIIIIIMAEWQLFNVAGYLIEERRRWPIITASPRGQCSK